MKHGIIQSLLLAVATLVALAQKESARYPGWRHTGSLHILTTPDGADLPATAMERDFPLLVWLHKDFFDFSQARADVRMCDSPPAWARRWRIRSKNGSR